MLLQISQSSPDGAYMTGRDLKFYAQKNTDVRDLIQKLVSDIDALTRLTHIHVNIDTVLEQTLLRTIGVWETTLQEVVSNATENRNRLEEVETLALVASGQESESAVIRTKIYCEDIKNILQELERNAKKEGQEVEELATQIRRNALELMDILKGETRVVRGNFLEIPLKHRTIDELYLTLQRYSTWKHSQIQSFLQAVHTQRSSISAVKIFWILRRLLDRLSDIQIELDGNNIRLFTEIALSLWAPHTTILMQKIPTTQTPTVHHTTTNFWRKWFKYRTLEELSASVDAYENWDGGQIHLFLVALTKVDGDEETIALTLQKFLDKRLPLDRKHFSVIREIISWRIRDTEVKSTLLQMVEDMKK